MLPAPTLESSPMVASPMYDRCGTLLPLPTTVFFISTKLPALESGPSSHPGRSRENGPTFTPSASEQPSTEENLMSQPLPTSESLMVAQGPMWQPSPIAVAPVMNTRGITTESCPISTLSLIHISEPTRLGMISYAVFC